MTKDKPMTDEILKEIVMEDKEGNSCPPYYTAAYIEYLQQETTFSEKCLSRGDLERILDDMEEQLPYEYDFDGEVEDLAPPPLF